MAALSAMEKTRRAAAFTVVLLLAVLVWSGRHRGWHTSVSALARQRLGAPDTQEGDEALSAGDQARPRNGANEAAAADAVDDNLLPLPLNRPASQPRVLFLPCFIDGFFSNVRQVVATIYVARVNNLAYVGQDLYYKFQDSGHHQGIDGPVNVFDFLDRDYMDKFMETSSQEEFWGFSPEQKKQVRASMHQHVMDQGLRCEIRASESSMTKGFKRWLRLYGLDKKEFLPNRVESRPEQQTFLDKIKTNDARERYIIAGTPNFDNMVKDYQLLSGVRTKGDLSEFLFQAFEVIQFSARARELAEKAKIKFGMKPNEAYMAVHVRRGNTYAIGGRAGQSTAQEVIDGVIRGEACVGRTLSTVFVSTVRPYLQGEIDNLQAAFPDKRIVGLGVAPLLWDELEPGLDSRKNTILRTAIEMQMWFGADTFGGSRSTMSSFMSLMRLAHAPRNDSDACNRFLQKSWLESRTKIEIP